MARLSSKDYTPSGTSTTATIRSGRIRIVATCHVGVPFSRTVSASRMSKGSILHTTFMSQIEPRLKARPTSTPAQEAREAEDELAARVGSGEQWEDPEFPPTGDSIYLDPYDPPKGEDHK